MYMVKVLVQDNNVEKALRKIKRKGLKEGFVFEQRRRNRYIKPNVRKVQQKKEQVRKELKRQRIQKQVWGF